MGHTLYTKTQRVFRQRCKCVAYEGRLFWDEPGKNSNLPLGRQYWTLHPQNLWTFYLSTFYPLLQPHLGSDLRCGCSGKGIRQSRVEEPKCQSHPVGRRLAGRQDPSDPHEWRRHGSGPFWRAYLSGRPTALVSNGGPLYFPLARGRFIRDTDGSPGERTALSRFGYSREQGVDRGWRQWLAVPRRRCGWSGGEDYERDQQPPIVWEDRSSGA